MAAQQQKPRLYYFNGRGKGEMTRLTCAAAGIEFDETNLRTREPFLQMIKDGKLLFGQLPLLEMDGMKLVGSDSIVRHLGRKAKLYGDSDADRARIDILVMGGKDFFDAALGGYLFSPNPEETIETKVLPSANNKYLPAFEKTLAESSSGFLVGSRLSIADIVLFDSLTHITDSPYPKLSSVLQGYPKCAAFVKFIADQPGIKEYLASPKRNPVPTAEYINDVKTTLGW
ncbi:glutathione S-transferase A4-like [Lytechinus variegatus]|uniref:glutathione S-transferase A4-like n=1 Tax=Lytechinus variegatus TaxID=7654 RepID=UPI001BB14932|nr:glutathione S-transferase A4-like [Lytechinus variegatus]